MLTYLLKSALPFTLTFILGAALGGFFFNPFGVRTRMSRVVRTEFRTYDYSEGRGCKHRRFRQRELVAETKPLVILFKPDARWPYSRDGRVDSRAAQITYPTQVSVTFGADGKVNSVEPVGGWVRGERSGTMSVIWDAVEKAARQIQFEPETINGLPVSVTKDVEIRFMRD